MNFKNSQEAFEHYYDYILECGAYYNGTKTLFNQGFTITNPVDNKINTTWRKWKEDYAEYEWQWYLSGNPNADEISKKAKIWSNMQDEAGNVRSNYGWQWNRENQLEKVINKLKKDPFTRQAVISIYDGKEQWTYYKDTPCTLSISFFIFNSELHMNVHMRSNDLIFGFCNDQYCFSKLQQLIAEELDMKVGNYHHSVVNFHIYERHFNLKNKC